MALKDFWCKVSSSSSALPSPYFPVAGKGGSGQAGLNLCLKIRPFSQLLTCFLPLMPLFCLHASLTSHHSLSLLPLLSPHFQRKGEMAAAPFLVNPLSTKLPPKKRRRKINCQWLPQAKSPTRSPKSRCLHISSEVTQAGHLPLQGYTGREHLWPSWWQYLAFPKPSFLTPATCWLSFARASGVFVLELTVVCNTSASGMMSLGSTKHDLAGSPVRPNILLSVPLLLPVSLGCPKSKETKTYRKNPNPPNHQFATFSSSLINSLPISSKVMFKSVSNTH